MIFYIAFRNITRNIKYSIIIFSLILVINTLLILGNTILQEIDSGLKRTYIDNFTGDILIKNKADIPCSIFGDDTPAVGEYYSIPLLKNHAKITDLVKNNKNIESFESIVSGKALLDIYGRRIKVHLFGVEGKSYFNFINKIEIIAGNYLSGGESGLMMSESKALQIQSETGRYPEIGEKILLSMYGNNGFRIREVPLSGIYKYSSGVNINNDIMLTDINTLRSLNSISVRLVSENSSLDVISDDIDSLFNDEILSESVNTGSVDITDVINRIETVSVDKNNEGQKTGGWNFILLKLDNDKKVNRTIKTLNSIFEKEGYGTEAVGWRKASGFSSFLVFLLKVIYNIGLLLIIISGLIAIVNTLFISVYERTNEIGTMRAFGATGNYIRNLIFLENIILSSMSGIVSIVLSLMIIKIINSFEIVIDNSLLRSLMGGEILNIKFSYLVSFYCTSVSIFTGLLSAFIPIQKAFKIQPVSAMRK